jgi:hypothetical protein
MTTSMNAMVVDVEPSSKSNKTSAPSIKNNILIKTVSMLLVVCACLMVCIECIPSIQPPPTLNHALEDRLMLDPSEFFQGSKPRPKLEIISPNNGEVLETSEVHIHLTVRGYGFPSNLRESRVCLGNIFQN